jgi:hypothetical protein
MLIAHTGILRVVTVRGCGYRRYQLSIEVDDDRHFARLRQSSKSLFSRRETLILMLPVGVYWGFPRMMIEPPIARSDTADGNLALQPLLEDAIVF